MKFLELTAAVLLFSATPATAVTPTNQAEAPPVDAAEAAATAVGNLDFDRIGTDRAYAEESLRHLDTLRPLFRQDPIRSTAVEGLRAIVLTALDRDAEARSAIELLLDAAPSRPGPYVLAMTAASQIPDPVLMMRGLEAVSQNVAPAERGEVFDAFDPRQIFALDRVLEERGLAAERARLSEALVAMDWPGPGNPGAGDYFRKRLLDRRLDQNRRQDAARLAREVRVPENALPLILRRRYDGLLGPSSDGLAYFERLLGETDGLTASAVRERPEDYQAIHERMEFLRGVGRDEEAVALARPLLADIPGTVARDSTGMWIVESAAGSLVTLGRVDEGLALMSRLVALDMSENPELIGPSINHVGLLWEVGRHEEALAHAERLAPLAAEHANDYGRMWIASYAACANLALGRAEAANARLQQLRAQPDVNSIALSLALLCANDLDASERLIIERLQSDDPDYALFAFQDYRITPPEGPVLDTIRHRQRTVHERPAVRAALERVGRALSLPLSRSYYGAF